MGMVIRHLRCFAVAVIVCLAIALGALSASVMTAVFAPAQAQVPAEFQSALEPYGSWQPHPRFGEVWVPYDLPPGWRPYTYGRWVYTEEWGWYWVSDEEEADWGWVAFHYGRWAHDPRLGWFWIPGDEWGPAWVDWRRGDDYVGWAPLPPDEVAYEYHNNPAYWIFLPPRYLVAPRVRTYILPPQRTVVVFRRTVIVNRTVRLEHRDHRGRFAVNPGIAPGIVAAAARRPVQTFRVQPRVLASTQGVAGAVHVRPQDLSRPGQGRHQRGQPRQGGPSQLQATVQPTQAVVQPVARVPQPQALRNDERGRLGPTPPRAAQGATVAPSPPPKSSPAPQPNGVPRGPTSSPGSGVQTPRPTPPVTNQPPGTPPVTTPSVTTPAERRDASPSRGRAGPPPQQPTIVRPIPPQGTPPSSPPPQPQQQMQRPSPPSSAPPPQQPAIVRPIPPQSAPSSSPPPPRQQQLRGPPPQPQQQMQPPPQPRQVQPPPQAPPQPRQVQPPPQMQRQVQPPPQQRPVQPPPAAQQQQKRPPPRPGEKPPEPPK
jgi:hypothetical protein